MSNHLLMITRFLCCATLIISHAVFAGTFQQDFVTAAIDRTKHDIRYDGAYHSIKYPGGDVPADIGVCTDVVIRTYRTIGSDLQQLVHEDMIQNFSDYPSKRIWGLSRTDRNIDHRRVANLQIFFSRFGEKLAISTCNPPKK